jgi:hypothetical protein
MAGPGCRPSGLDPTRTEESLATRPGYIAGPNYLLAALDGAQLAAFKAFADGVRLWRSELLAYFDEPTTDGYAEGVINKVKVIKRRAHGVPTFEGLRERDSQHAADGTTRRPRSTTRTQFSAGLDTERRARGLTSSLGDEPASCGLHRSLGLASSSSRAASKRKRQWEVLDDGEYRRSKWGRGAPDDDSRPRGSNTSREAGHQRGGPGVWAGAAYRSPGGAGRPA